MPITCLLPSQAEKLKKAFKDGTINFTKLYGMTSQERLTLFEGYLGNSAKMFTAKLEKAFLAPNQKQALKNITKEIAQRGKLYTGLKVSEASKLKENVKIKDLEGMSKDERLKEFSKYVEDKKTVNKLATTFEYFKKKGDLSSWEERAFGSSKLSQDKLLKGNLQRLEALDKMGVLNPKQAEQFMQNFTEEQLGVAITLEQSKKLSELIKTEVEAFDKLTENDDWTYLGGDNLSDYLNSVKEIKLYEQSLIKTTKSNIINAGIDYARGSILTSPRIFKNSLLYQAIPSVERTITKWLTPSSIGDKSLNASLSDMVGAKVYASKNKQETVDFVKGQLKQGLKIYKETGFDMARMNTIDDGYRYFAGEKIGKEVGVDFDVASAKTFKEKLKLIKEKDGKDKLKNYLGLYVSSVIKAPKWTAGGTDAIIANTQRAGTSIMMSKEFAYLEASKKEFATQSEKTKWTDDRALELLKDSYKFEPENSQAEIIRSKAILDANMANNTQDSFLAEKVIGARTLLSFKNTKFGKVLIPFARIASTTIQRGVEASVLPASVSYRIYKMNKASKISDSTERITEIQKQVSGLVGTLGVALSALVLSLFLDDDDYIAPWASLSYKEYNMAKARGAGSNMIRIGGTWIPLRFIPMINIPLSAIMSIRQAVSKSKTPSSVVAGYVSSLLATLLEAPAVKEIFDIGDKIKSGADDDDTEKLITSLGLNGEEILSWAKVRAIPSVISYDLANMMFPSEAKYDYLGRQTNKNRIPILGFKKDKSNDITLEFARLDNNGFSPAISDPSGAYAKELEDKKGSEEYEKLLAELKADYAEKVSETISKAWYKRSTNEEQKKEIDSIRGDYILKPLKEINNK